MADNTVAFPVIPPELTAQAQGVIPEPPPKLLWGQGTPDGDREPFISANKGSLYLQTDGSDDGVAVWSKVDEGNDNADWARAGLNYAVSKDFNIDNGSGTTDDDIVLVPDRAILVVGARAVYVEATDTSGAASANFRVGTAVGGEQIVADTALEVSKAIGSSTDGTIVSGAVAADGMIAVRHTGIAATEAGQYFVQIAYV